MLPLTLKDIRHIGITSPGFHLSTVTQAEFRLQAQVGYMQKCQKCRGKMRTPICL